MPLASLFRSALFWTGLSVFAFMGLGAALYGPALPAFGRAHGIDTAQAGLIVSAHNLGGLAGLLLSAAFGAVSARASLAGIAIGAALVAWAPFWAAALIGAVIFGAGYGLAAAVYNRRFLAESGPGMLGLLNAVFSIGAIAAPLLYLALGRSPAFAFALLGAAFLMLLPFAQGGGRPSPSVEGGAFPAITPRRAAFLLLGAFGVGFEVALIGLGPTALIARELSEKAAAELVSALFVFFLAARLALVWAAGRFAPLLLLAIAHGLGALCAALASALPPGAFYALAGASAGLMFPCFYIAASRFFGTSGRAAAAIMVPGYLGAILLPLGASQAMAAWGDAALFPLLACIAAAGCAATLFFARASADMR